MNFPIEVKSKLINPAIINDQYPYCISFTYFHGEQIIAYGSKNNVVIISNYLTIIDSLCKHEDNSYVTAVAWTPYSGRLSSCGTDLVLNIWEPVKNGWNHFKQIKILYEVNCISWNYLGTKFCIATKKDFSIYEYPPKFQTENEIQPIFTEQVKTNYCAFSRDSRFILTLQKDNQIYIWYRSPLSTTEYRRLILTHPTRVTSISWRLSEDFYERCSFMSITEDGVARIWIETCVMERLSFHVAISIPMQPISAGCFVMTTSKMINNRSSSFNTDKFANGNGHYYQTRDKNSRYSTVTDPREIRRNKSWVLCFHKDMKISIWELSGLSLSVRSTPRLRRLMLIDQTNTQFLRLERSFLPKLGFAIATSSKKYRLANADQPANIQEYITSLIFEDQRSHTLVAADIVKNKTINFSTIGMLKGHRSEIKMFKFHKSLPFMISIDEEGTASFWKVDDSDVYDPKLLIQFKFTIGDNVQIADFVKNSDQIIGYDGRSIFLVDYNSNDGIPGEINRLHSNFHSKGKIIDLTVLNSENPMNTDRITFVALFPDVFYICSLENLKVRIMFHKNREDDAFVKGMLGYLSTVTRSTTKFVYRIATKKKIISIKFVNNEEGDEKPIIYYKVFDIDFEEEDEEIVNMKNSRPATVCIVTSKNRLYMGRQLMSKANRIEILEKLQLNKTANPNVISCLPNGFLAIACEKEIQLYFTGRKSHEFTQSLLSLNCISCYKEIKKCASALDWMANGILIYSEQGQIFALTKFMNTYYLDSNIKLPTIHHSLVSLTFSVPDIHSTVISPLAISGRLNLVSKMLNYYDKHFYEDDCKMVLKKYILNMPQETDKEGKHLRSKKLGASIESLIKKITEENQKIDGKGSQNDREKKINLNSDSKTENNRLLFIVNKIKSIYDISFDILDKRALVFYRSFILSEKSHIPFDLVCCALMSHEKEKLYDLLNIQSWDTVERCGAVYWSDLSKLKETLVTIAIRDFNLTQHLSIFLLVLFKRFRALNHLYSNAGDEARASFFLRDFKTDKNRKSALNNAYSALSKHSFHISAAMFILAGNYDTALSVCSNIHDYSLSYLLTCFSDDKKLRHSFIENVLIRDAKEKNDLAAISLFEHLAYDKEIDFTLRMRQTQPGFLYNDMRIFGDVRFCACEVLKPTIETVRELSRSLLLAGHFFLAAQFIEYLNENIVHESSSTDFDNNSNSNYNYNYNISDILSNREFDSDIIMNVNYSKNRRDSNLIRKFPSSISFQVLHNIQEFENDDDENSTEIHSDKKEKVNEDKNESDYEYEIEEEDNDDDDDNLKTKSKRKKTKSKKLPKYEFGIDSILGYSTYFDDFDIDYEDDSFSMSEGNEEVEELNDDASDSDESEFIDNLKDSFKGSLVRSRTMNNLSVRCNLQCKNKNKKDVIEESTEINLSESYKSDSDFNTRFVLFNIARLRLETFLEQSLNLKEVEEIIPNLGKVIENFDNRIISIRPPLRDFLIQSCKRCSFVYRRFLLLSDQGSNRDYIVSLCHSLANLPDLLTSSYLTSQQIAQISHTIWCLTTYYNKELSGQPYTEMRFILAAISTGFFVVGCYNMNVNLLLTLLEQHLNSRKKYKFPQVLIDQIKVEIAVPENISVTAKKFEINLDEFNFISRRKENVFSYPKVNQKDLFNFMWQLFEMMLIDEFACMIDQIHVDRIKYQQFYTSIRKMRNLSMQMFIYAILNFPVILHIDSLEYVKIANKSVEKLYHFLLRKNGRERQIFSFCKEVYSQNSDINPFQITNVPEKAQLKNKQKIVHFKGGITSFCMSKDTIWAATPQGMKNCSTQDIESDLNEGNETNENEELNVQFDDEIIDDTSNVMSDEILYSTSYQSLETLTLRASDTSPSFHHKSNKYRISKKPCLILSHPSEDYMLVSDYEGNICARKYDDLNENNISVFHTRFKTKCTALGFQTTGTMFAAAQSSYVSLFSFCRDSYNKPYVTYDTYGSSIQSLAFVQGTGIFATCQKPSNDFDASVVFWDSILPPGTSMISSIKLEKVGKPLSICFSPKYKSVIVGTNKGSLVLIDTRKYEILKILKNAHEKNIRALTIDQNESYCVTGGGEGTVKVWDMRSLTNIGEMKNVHSPKTVKTGQKWKSYAITDIHIKNDIIYTAGFDGNIKRIEFA